jgi:hypothetical protein
MGTRENIAIKVSNFRAYAPDRSIEGLRGAVMACIDAFGPKRSMFGTDYPLAKRSMNYQALCDSSKQIVSSFSSDEHSPTCFTIMRRATIVSPEGEATAMQRRTFLATTAAALASPALATAQGRRALRFIPQADLAVLDPIWTTAYVTRNHGYLVWDTLYGWDSGFVARPQMVEGHVVENEGKLWKLTLRPGLVFHDGEPVRARDCVASLAIVGS